MKKEPFHISGKLHLTGSSRFIGDEAPLAGMLYASFLYSPVAHARIISIDSSPALQIPGVKHVITAKDIPGENMIGHVIKDEPLFPEHEIMFLGQPLVMILATDPSIAEEASSRIQLQYEELKPILEIEEADLKEEWYIPERRIVRRNPQPDSLLKLNGRTRSEAQEHFYMETQRSRAIPLEGKQIIVHTATQSTMECQEVIAHVLGIPAHNIIIEVPRLGGAFGGKERNATIWATMAALGAYVSKRPVEVLLPRDHDMKVTGKRHPFLSNWNLAYSPDGRVKSYDIELLSNGGAYADLSIAILERALFHAENIYNIPDIRIRGRACRTNLPPNTAFRGFGAPQGIFVIENIMESLAVKTGLDPFEIRLLNAYQPADKTPYGQEIRQAPMPQIFTRLRQLSSYESLKQEVQDFNASHTHRKQGLGLVPVKFGISFTTALLNQGSALVWVYIDGSVSVTTGGIEMGQELSTKVAIVVSRVLGLPLEQIHVESSNSQRIGNASPTAASTGSDINGNAARIAAEKIRRNLREAASHYFREQFGLDLPEEEFQFQSAEIGHPVTEQRVSFSELVRYAYNQRIALGAYGYYKTPDLHFDRELGQGKPFHYYVWGAALSRIELDLLSGDHHLLGTWIVHENGSSLHPEIDRGQVIGAFIQSMGWCTMEELPVDDKGRYLAVNPSTYKIPGIRDIPDVLELELLTSGSGEASVMGSKATGEPPFIYGFSVFFAIQNAIRSVNPEADLSFPATPEAALKALKM